MEKLLFLVPDTDVAKRAITSLHELGVKEDEVGVLANDQTALDDLPDAQVEDDSDVVPAFTRGIAAGGATGLLAGLAALAFPPLGVVAGGAALVATTTLGGASFGAFAAALVGTSVDNSQLRDYEDAIARGELLIIVDIGDDEARRNEIERAMADIPSVSSEGTKGAPPVV